MVKKIIFIVFIFFGFAATAQISKENLPVETDIFPTEKVEISINSPLLLAGELLQYKVFSLAPQNKMSNLSRILYVTLRSESDSIVFNHKLLIENGSANGDFFIPSSLKTGVYRLAAYTNFSRNNAEEPFAQKNIFIINTFLKPEADTSKSKDTINFKKSEKPFDYETNTPDNGAISIKTDKALYGTREKVVLQLNDGIPGNYALSVRKINPLSIPQITNQKQNTQNKEIFYVPELRGNIITGTVISTVTNLSVSGKEVSLTIPGKDYIFKISKTNREGKFFFSINEGFSAEKCFVQLIDSPENASKFKLVFEENDFNLGKINAPKIKLDENLKEWLEQRSVQLQIENAYFEAKKDSIFQPKPSSVFYDGLGTVFLLDHYTRFPSVRETFVEIVTLAAIRGSGTNARFVVNNEYDPNGTAKFNDIDPLVLMDGMQIQDNTDLINYNSREIESIRVIIQPYRYGPKIFSGIISVKTKAGDFVPSQNKGYVEEINFPSLVKQKKYYQPNYGSNMALSRIPDYRVQLLWNTEVNFPEKKYTQEFYTSDVPGVYEISLEGYSQTGVHISEKNYFTVE